MGRFLAVFRLGIMYLYRYRRRYFFLLAALSLCFAIVTFITSTKDGMYNNVYYAAQSHYAGDIVAVFYDSGTARDKYYLNQDEISLIINASSVIKPKHTVLRTMLYQNSAVFFNGGAVQLRYVIGCDWENEAFLFDRMSIETLADASVGSLIGDDGIILSLAAAQSLGALIGDNVILEINTDSGQKNTGIFTVKGIIQDVSIFGYFKAYISRLSLNRLKLDDDASCSTIGFFLDNQADAKNKRVIFHETLSEKMQTGPLVYTREQIDAATKNINGKAIFLYTLPVYLAEVSDLLHSIDIIAYFLYVMMLLIIMASATVTFRLILHERAKEMGIMRTIGFLGKDIRLVLFSEIIVLGAVSLIAGFILANIISWAVSFLSFSWFPSFEIFLKNGKLVPLYLPLNTLTNIVFIYIILLALALFSSLQVSGKKLTSLLSGEAI